MSALQKIAEIEAGLANSKIMLVVMFVVLVTVVI
jgi:hypothetical protein